MKQKRWFTFKVDFRAKINYIDSTVGFSSYIRQLYMLSHSKSQVKMGVISIVKVIQLDFIIKNSKIWLLLEIARFARRSEGITTHDL